MQDCGILDIIGELCPEESSMTQIASTYLKHLKKLQGFTLTRSRPGTSKSGLHQIHLSGFVFEDEHRDMLLSVDMLFRKDGLGRMRLSVMSFWSYSKES
jgi:hypothetical protein